MPSKERALAKGVVMISMQQQIAQEQNRTVENLLPPSVVRSQADNAQENAFYDISCMVFLMIVLP
jgi:hypothetical protein